jgi:Leucine-rich repeat (LRR) protein
MKYSVFLVLIVLTIRCTSTNNNENSQDKVMVEKAQDMERLSGVINNETIDYQLVMKSCDTCVPISNVGYRIVVNLPEEKVEKIRKITPAEWLQLLNNEQTDWAANLVLYYLHDKDALILSRHIDCADWKKTLKKEDIDYWNKKMI